MLYTLSKSQYDSETLQSFCTHLTENDVVILWQDGVLQAIKNRDIFANLPRCYLLAQDVTARGLTSQLSSFPQIDLTEFIAISEQYFPQIAL